MSSARRFLKTFATVVLGVLAASTAFAEAKVLRLYSFEPGETPPREADGEVVTENASHGTHAFKVTNPGEGYTGIRITDREMLKKFKDYVLLKADVYNPQDRVVSYALRVDDTQSKGYGTRYNDENFVAPPGRSMLELNITSLLRSSSKNFSARDRLDVAQLTLVNVFMGPKKEPTTLYFDNLRLESSGLPEVQGLHAFDFGPAKSAVYPGFEGVNEKMPFDPARGFGWDRPESCDRVYTPDDLGADFIRGGEFRLLLPVGKYEVNVCVDAFGAWHRYPTWQWRKIILNGKTVSDEKMSGEEFMEKRYFRHEDDEDLPGQDIWHKFVGTWRRVRRFETKVTDGFLTLKVDSDDKHGKPCLWMVVYPSSRATEGRTWMRSLDEVRKERFKRNLYVIVPKPENVAPTDISPAQRRFGFLTFVRHTEKDITVTDAPSDAERRAPLVIYAARGEREHAQLGIHPFAELADFTVKVSDFKGPAGTTIPASAVRVRWVRNFLKHMGRMRAGTLFPYILLDFEKLTLKPGVTRAVWITVQVPEDAAPGEYTAEVTLACPQSSKTVPLTLHVRPFILEKAQNITLSVTGTVAGPWRGWYPELEERWWKVADAVMQDLADHGMNAVTGGPGATLKSIEDGRAVIDYTDMDRWLALAVKHGLTMTGDSYQGLDVRGIPRNSRNLEANEKAAQQQFGVSYPELIRLAFEDVARHAKEKNWPPRVYYLLDEPRVEWGNIESAGELIKIWVKAAPDTLFSGYYTTGQGRDPYFETMPVSISHYDARAAELTTKAGKRLWDYDGTRVRYNIGRWAFAASRTGLKGYLRNGYMYCNSDPYFDFSDDEASWCVVYPSKRGINATVGWERTGQGANDYRYLEMVDRLIAKARAAGKAAAEADVAAAYLKQTLEPIDLTKRESADLEPEQYDAFRATLARHIIALRTALGE